MQLFMDGALMRRRAILLAMMLVIPVLSGCILAGHTSDIEVKRAFLTGNELRLVVQSAKHSSPFYSHMDETYDVRQYYVAIDMNSHKPLGEASTIVGPLSSDEEQNWQPEYIPGGGWGSRTIFEENGRLFKIGWDAAHTNWSRNELVVEVGGAKWRNAGTIAPLSMPKWPLFQANLRTPSGNRQVHFDEAGVPHLYETSSGREIDDAWLQQTLSRVYRISGVSNRLEDLKLTDDLRYVVYWPSGTFVWNGQTYAVIKTPYPPHTNWVQSRQNFALSFERPDTNGAVFGKGDWGETPFNYPIGYLSVGGELLFLKVNTNRFSLLNQRGEIRHDVVAPGIKPHYYQFQHDTSGGRVVFFDDQIYPKPFFWVGIWDLEQGTFMTRKIDLYGLFTHSISGLVPVKRIKPR